MNLTTWSFILSIAAVILAVPLTVLGNFLTPQIRDWWSQRSRRSLEKQIRRLKQDIEKRPRPSELLVLLSKRILLVLGIQSYLTAFGFVSIYDLVEQKPPVMIPAPGLVFRLWLFFCVLDIPLIVSIGSLWSFWRWLPKNNEQWLRYRSAVQERIDHLEQKLARHTKP